MFKSASKLEILVAGFAVGAFVSYLICSLVFTAKISRLIAIIENYSYL